MNANRLTALRGELARDGLDGFIVPRADEHLGEYVPEAAERLAWLTGFTGSAGIAAVLPDRAAVFTDGRYVLQLAAQTDAKHWERLHVTEQPPAKWVAENAKAGAKIGYDPMLFAEESVARFTETGTTMVPVSRNPVDAIWSDRPASPIGPAVPHPLSYAGRGSDEKRADIAKILRDAKQDAAVLTDPASVAWLLNIRGADVPFTPFALGFVLMHADGNAELFMEPVKVPEATRAWLGNAVSVAGRQALAPALARFAGKTVRVDPAGSPVWFAQQLRAAGATVAAGADPCLMPKARKNTLEQQGMRDAHTRDAVAMCRFLHWVDEQGTTATEMVAAEQLLAFRRDVPLFRGESFPAISGAGEHGAIIHYRVTPESDRPIKPNEVYLIDSGGQYLDGTTDITRTVWTGPGPAPVEVKVRVTAVMKGHIAIASAVFPHGVQGAHLDSFARRSLWAMGLDYDHGTGHGVGSYLSVHEGPVSLSRVARPIAIEEGMVLSDEPGFYLPDHYGIRLENLLLVRDADLPGAKKPFLRFETLTLAPFDTRLLEAGLLDPWEKAWLNAYHARVLETVGPSLPPHTHAWLAQACRAIA